MQRLPALATIRNSNNDDQSRLWRNYSLAKIRAEQTGSPTDLDVAQASWDLWLRAFLPDPEERRLVPAPRVWGGVPLMLAPNPATWNPPPPHNIEAEQGLLGAMLMNNTAFDAVDGRISADDFFEPAHQQIFEVASTLIRTGKRANPITLKSYLPDNIDIAGMPLSQYLARLCAEATATAGDYAALVRELADKRRILDAAEMIRAGAVAEVSASELATDAISCLDEIVLSRADTATPTIMLGDALHEANERLTLARANPGALGGLTTGLRTLDRFIDGWHPGELLVIGARPSMGKTGLAASCARLTAEAGHHGIFFSLEMGSGSIADRVLSDCLSDLRSGSPSYWNLRRGEVDDGQAAAVVEAMRDMRSIPLSIDPTPALTVSQIAARARRRARSLARKGKRLAFVVVDHIHIVRPNDRYRGNRTSEMAEISGALKALAKELNTAVIALAQLNRGVEGRDDKRPTMADLPDSGSIEQDADTIIFLFREEYYLQRTQFSDPATEDKRVARLAEVRNVLELIVSKQRNGPIGTQRIFFNAACNAARDLDGGGR